MSSHSPKFYVLETRRRVRRADFLAHVRDEIKAPHSAALARRRGARSAELYALDAPPRAQGQSLLPLIRGQDNWQPKPLFFETSASGYTAAAADYQKRYRAMRTRDG